MIRQDTDVRQGLLKLGLGVDQIDVYMALLRAPLSPLELSRQTGMSRTKIYMLLEQLEARSLVARRDSDQGATFAVTDPTNLGIYLNEREVELKEQQKLFRQLVPVLSALHGVGRTSQLEVHNYEGVEGFKRMLWHELKAKGELLSLGGGDVEELVPNKVWAKQHRKRVVEADYRVREIINSETDLPTLITDHDYLHRYACRGISASIITLEDQITIYNDTVAIYHWRQRHKSGAEIVSRTFATTMRSIFEHFWRMTEPANTRLQ